MSRIHLICNAHIDPFWQWDREEGAAAAMSTFRAAADFCEEFDDFIFCHNEALLYRWVEEYEPPLFARIQKLVKAGKWHIMGGWYLQPDCNMPSGESMIRQIKLGREYFKEKFGVVNTTAVSFDAFGHNRGLVQILRKAGYDSYLFMRPEKNLLQLPQDDFLWVGYDGSAVMAHRINTGYNSPLGHAKEKIEQWLSEHHDAEIGLIPWGVGNHGGGPSREDINAINSFKATRKNIIHSLPESYFADISKQKDSLPKFSKTLAPSQIGCYTSQIRVKQEYRALENLINSTEKMLAHAAMADLIEYPLDDINEAVSDLCLAQFHDILPGSSIQSVEESALQLLHHGKEIMTRLRAKAFYALASGQKKASPNTYPVLVYNPHPFEIEQEISCEFMLADQNWKTEFTSFTVSCDGKDIPAQVEKERSNIPLDWRKRVTFRAKLKPMQMNRFDCIPYTLPARPIPHDFGTDSEYIFVNGTMTVKISKKTGCITSYSVDGFEYLSGEIKLLAIRDSEDAWAMADVKLRDVLGAFELMDEKKSAVFSGVKSEKLKPIRVVEDGEVRTVIEACFTYGNSDALITYRLPEKGRVFGIDIRLFNSEKDTMIKLSVPTLLNEDIFGQGMFGFDSLNVDGKENVAQQWVGATGHGHMLAVMNNGIYGNDFANGEIRLSLARSAAYTGHTLNDRTILPQNRLTPRMEQGERLYTFELFGDETEKAIDCVTLKALVLNEQPFAVSFFPDGSGELPPCGATLSGNGTELVSLRMNKDKTAYIAHLFETTGKGDIAKLKLPGFSEAVIRLKPFEVVAMRFDKQTGVVTETDVLE